MPQSVSTQTPVRRRAVTCLKFYCDDVIDLFVCSPGLKQAVETVNDYNPLMKDFPLNDLLSATELDKIRQALVAIFTHLRKIRNTKYPIQRALRLVEAISRDLSSQLLKVLGTRKLMHVAYEEFEKVPTMFVVELSSAAMHL